MKIKIIVITLVSTMIYCLNLNAQWTGTGPVTTLDDVGIGTISPQTKLEVGGTLRITDNLFGSLGGPELQFFDETSYMWNGSLKSTASLGLNLSASGSITFSANSSSTSSDIMMTLVSSNVGIGTINPNSKLHINADINEDMLRIQSNGNTKFFVSSNFGTTIGAFNNPPVEGLYVHGNTSLGSATSNQKLNVNGAIELASTSVNTNGTIRYNGVNFQGHHNGTWLNLDEQPTSGGASVWTIAGNDTHYSTGRVGIGTSSPNSALHVNGLSGQNPMRAEIAGQTKFHVSSNGGVSIGTPSAPPGNGLAVSGNVGIGTTSPAHKLSVIGDVSISGAIVAPSDIRLKKDVKDIENALKIITQLSPKTYVYEENKAEEFGLSDVQQFGLIAQELEEVLPNLVIDQALTDEEGEKYKGIEYTQLIPILIQALKEMSADKMFLELKVELLEEKNVAIEESQSDLIQRISLLENKTY